MLPLPPSRRNWGWRERVRLGRDHYVRLDTSDCSVDPQAIGRMVDVTADLDGVKVRVDGRIVADHPRIWARGAVVADPVHRETAKELRQQFQQSRSALGDTDLSRDLADYDRGFGIGRSRVMASGKTTDAAKQITYLAGALKAPRITGPLE